MEDELALITRRNFIGGLIAAPAIVKIGSIMPIKVERVFVIDSLTELLNQAIARFAEGEANLILSKPVIMRDLLYYGQAQWDFMGNKVNIRMPDGR